MADNSIAVSHAKETLRIEITCASVLDRAIMRNSTDNRPFSESTLTAKSCNPRLSKPSVKYSTMLSRDRFVSLVSKSSVRHARYFRQQVPSPLFDHIRLPSNTADFATTTGDDESSDHPSLTVQPFGSDYRMRN